MLLGRWHLLYLSLSEVPYSVVYGGQVNQMTIKCSLHKVKLFATNFIYSITTQLLKYNFYFYIFYILKNTHFIYSWNRMSQILYYEIKNNQHFTYFIKITSLGGWTIACCMVACKQKNWCAGYHLESGQMVTKNRE